MPTIYQDVHFIQDNDAWDEFAWCLDISEDIALVHLLQWYHEDGEIRSENPATQPLMGYGDFFYESDGFIMGYNRSYGVAGLWAKITA